jgi:MFS family permease
VAAALALVAAVSLGLARFSYALLLPPMRADLGWSYLTAGAMNTVNAVGYLAGAVLLPQALARFDARSVLLAGSAGAGLLLIGHGFVVGELALFLLRLLAGAASAAAFIAGGLLAARLASQPASRPALREASAARKAGQDAANGRRAGLVLGLYYGGTGVGIVASALLVPPLAGRAGVHAWQGAWIGLGVLALLATGVTWAMTAHLAVPRQVAAAPLRFRWAPFGFALAAYLLFGLGYIGYMTFVVTLLREQRMADEAITAFYALLGAAVIASSWLWPACCNAFAAANR